MDCRDAEFLPLVESRQKPDYHMDVHSTGALDLHIW